MKHDGIIPSDEAKKLYAYPTLSGDSDTFLNGAGDFDHPHVEYGKQSGYPTTNMVADINNGLSVSQVITDKYGHVTALLRHQLRWRYNSKAQRIYNAFPDISSDVSLAFTDIVLANDEHISVLTVAEG